MGESARRWVRVLGGAAALGVLAVLVNTTRPEHVGGDGVLLARLYLSRLVNAGVVWAGIGYVAGWVLRRPAAAALAGVLAGEVSLAVHYGLGLATGLITPAFVAQNASWFVVCLVTGVPLGLLGAAARRGTWWGVPARYVLPLGAVAEPWVRGAFAIPASVPWPSRWATVAAGVTLLLAGILGAVLVTRAMLRAWRSSCPS